MKVIKEREGSKITHGFEEMTPEKRPQDPTAMEPGWCSKPSSTAANTRQHAAGDTCNAEGRSCVYVPITVDGKVVDSTGFTLEPAAADPAEEDRRGFA